MSTFQLARFEQHHELPQVGVEGQNKFHNAKVLVVGAGGLGCPALTYLVTAGIGTIGIVDEDKVSLSNLQRQFLYGNKDIGLSKVLRAEKRLSDLTHNQKIITYPYFLTEENAFELIKDYDIVIDATDNHRARLAINSICRKLKKPWVYGALYHFEMQLMVFPNQDQNEPCFQCLYSFLTKESTLPTCKSSGVLSSIPGILGSMQATETLKALLDKSIFDAELLLINMLNHSFYKINIPQNKNCSVCS